MTLSPTDGSIQRVALYALKLPDGRRPAVGDRLTAFFEAAPFYDPEEMNAVAWSFGPVWPGVGECWYQPAWSCAVIGGTCTLPSCASPSRMTGVSTPITGIRSRAGTERPSTYGSFAASAEGWADTCVPLRRVADTPSPPWPAQLTSSEASAAVTNVRLES